MLTQEGIVIKTIKYQETSKIAFILNENGISSYLIRNANNFRSKNFSYSQDLLKISFDVAKKKTLKDSFDIITSGKVVSNYSNIKNNIETLFNVVEILEIVYSLSMHVNDNKTFYNFLSNILELIDEDVECSKIYNLIFKIKLLYLLGIAPNLTYCSRCHKKDDLYSLQLDYGTSLCRDCFSLNDSMIYGRNYVVFKYLYVTKLDQLDKNFLKKNINDEVIINELNEFLDKYYDHYLSYKSKTQKIINKFSD